MNLPPPPDRWTIDIANGERINAISSFGFTERQARFLVHVLLHAGIFVERQYCAFDPATSWLYSWKRGSGWLFLTQRFDGRYPRRAERWKQ